jgi:hypothetical protein
VRSITTAEQVFLTDGTVAHVLAVFAVVIIKQLGIDAHATVVTVLKVLASTHTAKAAVFAMIRRLLGRHPKVANIAVVITKLDSTGKAVVSVQERDDVDT